MALLSAYRYYLFFTYLTRLVLEIYYVAMLLCLIG